MATKKNVERLRKPLQTFAAKHCSELSYRVVLSKDKFDIDGFSKAVAPFAETPTRKMVTLVPKNSELTDFHLHVYWKPEIDDLSRISLQIDIHAWQTKTEQKHNSLFAEDFFEIARKFIQSEKEMAHVHAEFEYSTKNWQTRIMALPIKVPFGGKMAQINGLSVNLPSSPQGVEQVWLLRTNKYLTLQLYADRTMELENFTPYDDVDALSSVAKSLIEEKQS